MTTLKRKIENVKLEKGESKTKAILEMTNPQREHLKEDNSEQKQSQQMTIMKKGI